MDAVRVFDLLNKALGLLGALFTDLFLARGFLLLLLEFGAHTDVDFGLSRSCGFVVRIVAFRAVVVHFSSLGAGELLLRLSC